MKNKLLLTLLGCALTAVAQNSVVSLSPLNGSGTSATFTSVYRHAGGVNENYLTYLLVLPTPNIVQYTATGSCLVEYNRISNGMRLIDNAGTGWLGPLIGVPVGPGGFVLSNSHCSVNTAAVQVSFTATDIITVIPIDFTTSIKGFMGTFLQTLDVHGVWTGMTQFGNWTANPISQPKPGPYNGPVTVPAYTLSPNLVDVYAGHTSGFSQLLMVNILIAESIVGGNVRCHIVYLGGSNEIRLINDAGTGFVTGSPQGNTNCVIGNRPPELLYAVGTGNEIHLHIPMEFNPAKVNQRLTVWVNTFDTAGNLTHWQTAP